MKQKRFFGSLAATLLALFIVGIVTKQPVDGSIINSSSTSHKTIVEESSGQDISKVDKEIPSIKVEEQEEGKGGQQPEVAAIAAQVHFIDTGNSDSILIINGDKSVLIDGGDNDDEALVSSYIKNQGIESLTYVIATHPDADHIGGLDAVLNSIPVENLFVSNRSAESKTYRDFINAAANKGINPSVPLEGSEFKLTDNSYIKFFNTDGGRDANESSLVTLFINGNDKFLFMGDAESETEKQIATSLSQVDVLKVGHHGSKTSTTESFLERVAPKYAILLVGANNKYNHPASEVMSKLENKKIEVHRSDECGHIIFESTGKGISTSCGVGSYTPGDKEKATTSSGDRVNNTSSSNSSSLNNSSAQSTNNEGTFSGKFIITQTGTKYHLPSCSTIKQIKLEVTREEAEAQGYGPCGICNP